MPPTRPPPSKGGDSSETDCTCNATNRDSWSADAIEIRDTDTGRVCRTSATRFEHYRWELERGYGRQYAVALSRWTVENPNDPQLRLEVEP